MVVLLLTLALIQPLTLVIQMVNFDPQQHIRSRLTDPDGLQTLAAWADEQLTQPTSDFQHELIDPLPEHIRQQGVNWAVLTSARINGQTKTVLYTEFGGGFHHFGLVFGAGIHQPDLVDLSGTVQPWGEGVWFRDESNSPQTADVY